MQSTRARAIRAHAARARRTDAVRPPDDSQEGRRGRHRDRVAHRRHDDCATARTCNACELCGSIPDDRAKPRVAVVLQAHVAYSCGGPLETRFHELKRYGAFTDDDARLLARLRPYAAPHFARIAQEFYDRIREHEQAHPGLPSPDAPIFAPFFSTKADGTGLGLAISHRIVSDHGGDLVVESKPKRTIFRVSKIRVCQCSCARRSPT